MTGRRGESRVAAVSSVQHSSPPPTRVNPDRSFFLFREQSSKWIKSLATRNPCLVPTTHGWIKRDCFGNLSLITSLSHVPPFAQVANLTHLPSFLLAFAEKASQLESVRNA